MVSMMARAHRGRRPAAARRATIREVCLIGAAEVAGRCEPGGRVERGGRVYRVATVQGRADDPGGYVHLEGWGAAGSTG